MTRAERACEVLSNMQLGYIEEEFFIRKDMLKDMSDEEYAKLCMAMERVIACEREISEMFPHRYSAREWLAKSIIAMTGPDAE